MRNLLPFGRRGRPATTCRSPVRRVRQVLLVSCVLALSAPLAAGAATPERGAVAQAPVRTLASPQAVASARGTIVSLYASPTSRTPYRVLSAPAGGQPLVFLVSELSLAPSWVRVYLPLRPNGSQAWIHGSAVQLASDNYLVEANLTRHRLYVFSGSRPIVSAPVGVGRSVLPTPTGVYYLVGLLKQPDPHGEYGPYAFGLSAYSDVLQSFGGGPGEIGLHGTDVPSSVGGSLSHGCLRLSNSMITELARILPLGTPVVISR